MEHESKTRSLNVKKHIYFSTFLKGLSVLLNFLLVPITISYLGNEYYGIWIFLLSIISWISLFDIGIGNGLRNKLAIALANNDTLSAKKIISTAYFLIFAIGVFLIFISIIIILNSNWEILLNIKETVKGQLMNTMLMYIITLIISFMLNLINPVLNAFQLSSFTNFINILTSIFFLILLSTTQVAKNNITILTSYYCISLIASGILVNAFFFKKRIQFMPSFKDFDFHKIKELLQLGSSFFIIQIGVLIIFTIDNYLILQFLGPSSVAKYNIAFKMFSFFTILYGILLAPLWSAYTEAYLKKDVFWIKKIIRRLNISIIPLIFFLLLLIKFNKQILSIWIPQSTSIYPDLHLMISLSFFVLVSIWNNIYSYFLNGISDTNLQVKTAIFGMLLNIPLAYFLAMKMNMGISGVVWSMTISLSFFSILGPIRSFQLINKLNTERLEFES